jgi:hypothetical protein
MREAKAAIGFRAKTGRAIAVALVVSSDEPALIWRREVSLIDPDVPETAQPYHEVMELPWPRAVLLVKPFVSAIEAVASAVLGTLLRELTSRRLIVHDVGIVGSLDRNLESLGNPHIRAHAAEGMLFRRVLETAAATHGISSRSFSEQTITLCALSELDLSRAKLGSHLKTLGTQAGPPWRVEEKAAATAAWLAAR